MTTIIYKAQPTHKGQSVPDLHITAAESFPETENLSRSRILYDVDAKELVDALFNTLPGGTLDAILVHMLDRKRSLLRRKF